MRKDRIDAVPGQRIVVKLQPNAGFPVHIQIGTDIAPAWIEKEKVGESIRVIAWRTCPQLGKGSHELVVHDSKGSRSMGTVVI